MSKDLMSQNTSNPRPMGIMNIRDLPMDLIYADKQIREDIDDNGLTELTRSIENVGLLEPIAVRPMPDGRYSIIYGERRYRAALAAGATTITSVVHNVDEKAALLLQITENMARKDLNPIEEALGISHVRRVFNWSTNEMSAQVGVPRRTLDERLKLLHLIPELRDRVSKHKMALMYAIPAAKLGKAQQSATLRFLDVALHPSRRLFAELCQRLAATEGISAIDQDKQIDDVLRMMIRRAGETLPKELERPAKVNEGGRLGLPSRYPEHPRLPAMPKAGSLRIALSRYIKDLTKSDDPEFQAAALILGKVYNSISPDSQEEPPAE